MPALWLQAVSRVFPQDVADTAWALLREMLAPRCALRAVGARSLHRLQGIHLTLAQGERLGILGAHRSGKSTLAAIAAGVLAPTSGQVVAGVTRLLLARPTAGFKPGLTLRENLALRALLHGVYGAALETALERSFACCGVRLAQAQQATGNLSPLKIKQLALALLLHLPGELLVVDEIVGAGKGDTRGALQALLQARLQAGSALVFAADPAALRGRVAQACVLHEGRLLGPFDRQEAAERYEAMLRQAIADGAAAGEPSEPAQAELEGEIDAELDADADVDVDVDVQARDEPLHVVELPRWDLRAVEADGEPVVRRHSSVWRLPGQPLRLRVTLRSLREQAFTGGWFELSGGGSGLRVAHLHHKHRALELRARQQLTLDFDLTVPDAGEAFYELAFCPALEGRRAADSQRLRLLCVGAGPGAGARASFVSVRAIAPANPREKAEKKDGIRQPD